MEHPPPPGLALVPAPPAEGTNAPRVLKEPAKRFVGRARRIPDDIVGDAELSAAIAQLPANYNFEVHKTVWRAREVRVPQRGVPGLSGWA